MNPAPMLRTAQSAGATIRERAQLLLRPDRRFGRAFENLILALIVLSVASVLLETTPGLPDWCKRAFHISEMVVVAVFSFKYLLRLVAARWSCISPTTTSNRFSGPLEFTRLFRSRTISTRRAARGAFGSA